MSKAAGRFLGRVRELDAELTVERAQKGDLRARLDSTESKARANLDAKAQHLYSTIGAQGREIDVLKSEVS